MRYLSVCSGIEAATVAWHHLGWTLVGFSEIEPFPSAVLAHHYPHVPNYGDMTKHKEWPIEPGTVDLLVGGTPCQSFSVAGLRRGLSDPRGGLMLTYLEIAQRLRPRWVVWENVPGVLSSNGGRDFGSFLGALGDLGYGWSYRVLDAQWVRTQRHPRAVPQRRRRVFVVGRLIERGVGDWTAAASVLLESESVQRDLAKKRTSGKGAASDAEGCARGGCVTSHDVAPCLETTSNDYSRADGFTMVAGTLGKRGLRSHTELDGHGAYIPVSGTIAARFGQSRNNHEECVVQPVAFAFANRTRDGIKVPEVMADGVTPALTNPGEGGRFDSINIATTHPVPYRKSKRAQSTTDDETWVQADQANTLNAFDTGERDTHAVAFGLATSVTPKFGIDVQPTITVPSPSGGGQPPAVAFNWQNGGGYGNANEGLGIMVEGTGPLQRCNTPAVAIPMTVRRLTPRECERLQAFPDDYTMIPWRKKPAADCPDGPRYKALGNSMAVNCMEWIGERIAAYEARSNA